MAFAIVRSGLGVVAATMLLAGCRGSSPRSGTPVGDQQPVTTKPTGDKANPKPDVPDDSWVYRSQAHGFSLRLPSAKWKESTKHKYVAKFVARTSVGSPMLSVVKLVTAEDQEQYRASVKAFQAQVNDRRPKYLKDPLFQEGATTAGDPYTFGVMVEKGHDGSEYYYLACSYTWLKAKGTTVLVLFEGHGKMLPDFYFRPKEQAAFEKAARTICLSVEAN